MLRFIGRIGWERMGIGDWGRVMGGFGEGGFGDRGFGEVFGGKEVVW